MTPRWVFWCLDCSAFWSWDGEDPFGNRLPGVEDDGAPAHVCFPEAGYIRRARVRFDLVTHREPLSRFDHCRRSEPRQVPPPSRRDRDGACSWNCRGSQSALCFCPCGGARHAETSLRNPKQDPAAPSAEDIMQKLIDRTPDREVARKARRST